jgi:hypothetical protein
MIHKSGSQSNAVLLIANLNENATVIKGMNIVPIVKKYKGIKIILTDIYGI